MRQELLQFADEIQKQVRLHYLRHLPPAFWDDPEREWPRILFLHDQQHNSDNLNRLWESEFPRYLRDFPEYEAIVLSPQCPPEDDWRMHLDALQALLNDPATALGADPKRLVFLGIGSGAVGAVRLALRMPDAVAALVLIGVRATAEQIRALQHIPIWFFHGEADPHPIVDVHHLQRLHGHSRLMSFSLSGRDIWTSALTFSDVLDWMRQQHRPTP